MKHTKTLLFFLLLALIPAMLVAAATVGQQAPDINATDWLNSTPLTLAALKGRVVVVEFWATWCPPCRRSIPHLVALYNEHLKKPITFISLTRESKSTVERFMQSNPSLKMPYPLALGPTSSSAYAVRGIPHAFVIGPDGKILWRGHPMSGGFKTAITSALALVKDGGNTPDSPGKNPDDSGKKGGDTGKDGGDTGNDGGDDGKDGGDTGNDGGDTGNDGGDDGNDDGGDID